MRMAVDSSERMKDGIHNGKNAVVRTIFQVVEVVRCKNRLWKAAIDGSAAKPLNQQLNEF